MSTLYSNGNRAAVVIYHHKAICISCCTTISTTSSGIEPVLESILINTGSTLTNSALMARLIPKFIKLIRYLINS